MIGVVFPVGLADNAEVLPGDETEKGQVADSVVTAFPITEKLLVSLLAGGVLRQAADEVDPVLPGGILEWP